MSVSQITAPDLSEYERTTLARLLVQLDHVQGRNRVRLEYANREKRLRKFGFSVPPTLRKLAPILGWPEKAVQGVDLRLNLERFVVPGMRDGDDRIKRIWDDNELAIEIPQAHASALQLGCAFAFVTAGDPSRFEPRAMISVRSGTQATALWNRRTRSVDAGLSVVDVDDQGQPAVMNMYLRGQVISLTKMGTGWKVERINHQINHSLVFVLPHLPYLDRPFGVSRITQTVMDLTDGAVRTMLRAEGSAEFYSSPQRWALNLSEKQYTRIVEQGGWATLLGSIFATEAERTGGGSSDGVTPPHKPEVGQFQAASQQPHIDHLRQIAQMFAAETSLALNSLGVVQDNPASAEAIDATREDIITLTERNQTVLGHRWNRIMRAAVMVHDGVAEVPADLREMSARWRSAKHVTQASQSQVVEGLVREGVLPPHSEVTYEMLGLDRNTIERLTEEWDRQGPSDTQLLADALTRGATPTTVTDPQTRPTSTGTAAPV